MATQLWQQYLIRGQHELTNNLNGLLNYLNMTLMFNIDREGNSP